MTTEQTSNGLWTALAAARLEIQGAAHDAKNDFHGYKYTSAEEVIDVCTKGLAKHGVSLIPMDFAIGEPKGDATLLKTQWMLCHEGGQVPIEREFVAIPGKGRPLDKAILGANTTLYAYILRDICGLKRPESKDDVSGRDDTSYTPPPATRAKPAPKAESRTRKFDKKELLSAINKRGWSKEHATKFMADWQTSLGKPATPTQRKALILAIEAGDHDLKYAATEEGKAAGGISDVGPPDTSDVGPAADSPYQQVLLNQCKDRDVADQVLIDEVQAFCDQNELGKFTKDTPVQVLQIIVDAQSNDVL
jgi:hypothetical protein